MKRTLAIMLSLVMLTGCVSRKPKEEEQVNHEPDEVQQEQQNEKELDFDETKDETEEEQEEIEQYTIRETGFGITMEDGWEISALPEPMGIMVMKDGNMQNSGTIQVVYGEEKSQMEKDFEGNFHAMEEDSEIQNYFCDQSEEDGLYRIKLEYESVDEATGNAVLSRVIYQEAANDGLIIASFQFSQDYKADVKAITNSISKLVSENPLEPKEIEQLS